MKADFVLQSILEERARQDAKWGEQNHPDEWWLPILVEEVGELSEAMLDFQFSMSSSKLDLDVKKELVELVAVGVAWLECMERRV